MYINITCAEIQTPVGFLYVVLPVIMNHTSNPDCEQSWFSMDRHLIADPSDHQILVDPAISVSSDRLVTSRCVNLIHQIICDSADGFHFSHEIKFRVRNETAVTPNPGDLNTVTPDLQPSDQLRRRWGIPIIALALSLLMTISLIYVRRIVISRSGQKSEHLCDTRNYSESRYPEVDDQMMFGSDPPEHTVYYKKRNHGAGVQKKLRLDATK
ncbi:hypothetical protein QQF64_026243 [Cirrhinus molitorella]|uniref:Uncharacterized protein n=1 Tax=Cirrhinus molitorella TaxID=172907 RepID=A0ABR3NRB8_9TELE